MSEIIRLIYASKATFAPAVAMQGVEPTVARILMQSRRNNSQCNIGGVLYFGDGYFFQALEGERKAVNDTYQRIAADERHQQVTILSLKTIDQRLFSDWSMKYVAAEQAVRAFISSRDYLRFAPLHFSEREAEDLIAFFHRHRDDAQPARTQHRAKFSWRNLFRRNSKAVTTE